MTEKNRRSKKSARGIASIVMIALAVIILAGSVFGFIQQGTQQTRGNMLDMRDQAVVYASSRGLISSIARQARSEKMAEHSKSQSKAQTRTMTTEELRAELDKAEEATRAEAEKLFTISDVPDKAAFREAVDQMSAAVSESTGLRDQEMAVYDDLYKQLVESIPRWQDIVPEKNTGKQEIIDALIKAVPDLGKEENSHLLSVDGFVKMAKDMAEKEKEQEETEQKEHVLQGVAAVVSNWLDFADGEGNPLEDDAIWEKLQANVPDLAEDVIRDKLKIADDAAYDQWKKDLVGGVKDCVNATSQGSGLPSWAAPEEEKEETELGEIRILHDYFVNSAELDREEAEQKKAYEALEQHLKVIIPQLDHLEEILPEMIPQLYKVNSRTGELKLDQAKLSEMHEKIRDDLNKNIETILATQGKGFDTEYQMYADNGAKDVVQGSLWQLELASLAKYLLLIGIAVLLMGLMLLFWKPLTARLGVPRTIIILFFCLLCLLAEGYRISVGMMLGNVLERMTMYGILVLAMMPGIQCGIGLNMGMTIGCISGLLGIMVALQYNMTGFEAMAVACGCGIVVALPLGWAYAKLLNRMKGNEMTISTYVGFSFVSLMCIGWMLLPFDNPKIVWLLSGKGLRVTHGLLGSFAHILDNALSFKVLGIKIPTGGLLFLGVCCLLMWVFTRSKTGIAMKAVGSNPRFAEASGISVNRMRTIGTVLSTVIAAVGIVIYSQAFGYAQLYTAPKQLGFIASSAILIGGASVTKAKVSHVLLGVFLFEGVLVFGQQIANSAIAGGGLSEVMRILISNGIILYALTQSGGGRHE